MDSCSTDRKEYLQILKYFLQLFYALPISILYLLVILSILKRHKTEKLFSDAFFKLYVLDGTLSLIIVIMDYSLNRIIVYIIPICNFFLQNFGNESYVLTPYVFLINYLQFAKFFSITLLCANRFTCVVYPIFHTMFWKNHTNKVIIISLIFPIFFTFHLAISKTFFEAFNGEGILNYTPVVPFIRTTYFKFAISFSAFLFIIISNIATFRSLKKLNTRLRSIEISLSFATIIMSLVFIAFIIVQLILIIFSTQFLKENLEFGSTIIKFQYICNDFYLISSPIVLLVMTRKLRTSIFKPFYQNSIHKTSATIIFSQNLESGL